MLTLTFINEKGGVAKTTLAVNTAAILSQRGARVVLLDGDSQGHATMASGVGPDDLLLYYLRDGMDSRDAIIRAAHGNYGVIPSSTGTRTLAKFDGIPITIISDRLAELDGYINYVIIDTAPSISDLHTAFYLASDYVILPTECKFSSIQGVNASMEHLQRAQTLGADRGYVVAQALGIIPTKYDRRESVQQENLKYLRDTYGALVWSPIRARTAWSQAEQFREPVTDYAPGSQAAADALAFVDRVVSSVRERV